MRYKSSLAVYVALLFFLTSSVAFAGNTGKSVNSGGSFFDEVVEYVEAYFTKLKKKPHAIEAYRKILLPRPVSMLKPGNVRTKRKAPVSALKALVGPVKKKKPMSPLRRINADSKKPALPY